MVLASQMARPGTTRSNMYARGGARRNRLIAIVVGAAVLVLAAWWFWPRSSDAGDRTGSAAPESGAGLAGAGGSQPGTGGLNAGLAGGNLSLDNRQARRDAERPIESPLLPAGENAIFEPVESPSTDVALNAGNGGGAAPLTMGESPAKEVPEPKSAPAQEPAREPAPSSQPAPPIRSSFGEIDAEVAALLERADREINAGRFVEGRATLNAALQHPRVDIAAEQVRTRLAELNATMVFGKTVVKGDPFAATHVIKTGDRLVFLAREHAVDHRFLARINGMANPDQIRLGQSLKVINGPFHVEIDKSDFRMDLFLGEAGSSSRTYVRSFFIGLGELGSTPTGLFRVRGNGKLEDPAWTNPRTGEHFRSKDPNNPIGKFWIGLEGIDERTRLLDGYGIHGTIEPKSIGREMSMGCIRLYDDDIALLYAMLAPEKSTVLIRD